MIQRGLRRRFPLRHPADRAPGKSQGWSEPWTPGTPAGSRSDGRRQERRPGRLEELQSALFSGYSLEGGPISNPPPRRTLRRRHVRGPRTRIEDFVRRAEAGFTSNAGHNDSCVPRHTTSGRECGASTRFRPHVTRRARGQDPACRISAAWQRPRSSLTPCATRRTRRRGSFLTSATGRSCRGSR